VRILKFTIFVTAIRWFLVFAFAQNIVVLFFAQSLHALSFALFHSAAISYLHHIYTNKTLSQQFFSGITYGFGGLSGALIAGFVYEWYPKYLFLSSSLIACCALVFMYLYNTQYKEQKN
jgi:PPP family 3-phenylpropionic acid transporter